MFGRRAPPFRDGVARPLDGVTPDRAPDARAAARADPAGHAEIVALREAAVGHLNALLQGAGLNIHHVTGRVKKPASLADKLRRKPGRYAALEDVTDLVGVRIITYFESDVNVVSRLVESAYDVDWNHSVDKSKRHDPDRFGYMGVHYVVRATPQLPEFAALGVCGLYFEIQIRSILQHAWAEIEHDLGYKNPEAVPREVRRRFYRLSGLLRISVVLGLGLSAMLTLGTGAMIMVWPVTADYETCMSQALTEQAGAECTQQYEQTLLDWQERLSGYSLNG